MQVIAIVFLCLYAVLTHPAAAQNAEDCHSDTCVISNECRCSNITSPVDDPTVSPQLISLTFDESVVDNLFTEFWQPLLFDRVNPDGKPISATFFVPHEYTDYSRVQDLYVHGFEIGVNSITKNSSAQYWTNATVETLTEEFQGQRCIVSTFANILIDDIVGARTPQLQIEGDVTINAYAASGVTYDSSWITRSTSMLFPYTLDYLSTQECRTGTTCPKQPHSKFWIAPIIDLQTNDTDGHIIECNVLLNCNFVGSADQIASWLWAQVEREYNGQRAPLTLMVSSAWFRFTENSQAGFEQFLDTLRTYNDIYLVSVKQAIDWVKNPVPASEFQTDAPERTSDCLGISCPLNNEDGNVRYMVSCIPCPDVYPWLGNPLGTSEPSSCPDPGS